MLVSFVLHWSVGWGRGLHSWRELETGVLLENGLPDRCASLKWLLLLAHDSRWCWNPRSDIQLFFEVFLGIAWLPLRSELWELKWMSRWDGEWLCHQRNQELQLLLGGKDRLLSAMKLYVEASLFFRDHNSQHALKICIFFFPASFVTNFGYFWRLYVVSPVIAVCVFDYYSTFLSMQYPQLVFSGILWKCKRKYILFLMELLLWGKNKERCINCTSKLGLTKPFNERCLWTVGEKSVMGWNSFVIALELQFGLKSVVLPVLFFSKQPGFSHISW